MVTFVDPANSVSALSFVAVLGYAAALFWLAFEKRGRLANALFLGLIALGSVAAIGTYYSCYKTCAVFHQHWFSRFGSFNKGWRPGVDPWALLKWGVFCGGASHNQLALALGAPFADAVRAGGSVSWARLLEAYGNLFAYANASHTSLVYSFQVRGFIARPPFSAEQVQNYLHRLQLAGLATSITEGGLHARAMDQWVLALEQNSDIGAGVYVPWLEALYAGVGLRVVTSLTLVVALSVIAGSQSALLVPT